MCKDKSLIKKYNDDYIMYVNRNKWEQELSNKLKEFGFTNVKGYLGFGYNIVSCVFDDLKENDSLFDLETKCKKLNQEYQMDYIVFLNEADYSNKAELDNNYNRFVDWLQNNLSNGYFNIRFSAVPNDEYLKTTDNVDTWYDGGNRWITKGDYDWSKEDIISKNNVNPKFD